MTAKTIPALAKEAGAFLRRGEREADGIGKILLPTDDCPAWFTYLKFEAQS